MLVSTRDNALHCAGTVTTSPAHRLFDSHIFQRQSGAVFDAAEVFEAYSPHLWSGFSVIGRPPSEPGNNPGGEGERTVGVRILLLVGSALELGGQCFKHRLVVGIESVG